MACIQERLMMARVRYFEFHIQDTGACYQDVGGPLVCDGKLTGIISWVDGCAQEGYPTVFTNVENYADWIISETEGSTTIAPTTITTPEQGTTTPEHGTTTPDQGTTTPGSATTTPDPITTTPEEGTTTPEPATTTPEAVTTSPMPVTTTPKPITPSTTPVTTTKMTTPATTSGMDSHHFKSFLTIMISLSLLGYLF